MLNSFYFELFYVKMLSQISAVSWHITSQQQWFDKQIFFSVYRT